MTTTIDSEVEEQLRKLEPPYKSRGEAQVGRLLDRYGVPFFYEQPHLIYDRGRYRAWHPDFTLPDYNGMIVEYAGMMDVPDYAEGIRHKKRAYRRNGIPAMFVYPTDLRGPLWPEKLYHRIQRAYQRTVRHRRPSIPYAVGRSYR